MKEFFWFKQGELAEIIAKLKASKLSNQATEETTVLGSLAFSVALGFYVSIGLGLILLLWAKWSIQALNNRGFFDPQK